MEQYFQLVLNLDCAVNALKEAKRDYVHKLQYIIIKEHHNTKKADEKLEISFFNTKEMQ